MKPASWFPIAALVAASLLVAQGLPDNSPQPGDPPSRVARLNWLSGDVSLQPAGLDDWTDATVNYPLTTSDHLFTGKDSRIELHIGSNAIRLDANTNFGFLNLDDSIVEISVTEGSVEIRLRSLDDNDTFEIATPNGAITLLQTGDYRIDTDPNRDATMLTVRSGRAELFSGANSVLIRAQQTAYFQTDQNPDVRIANDPDDFDTFAAAREDSALPHDSAPSTPVSRNRFSDPVPELVSEGVTGAEDLNAYGSWQNSPGYGQVWVPPVDSDWDPYSDGDWAWVGPWGWTWIDAAPWGFAPFHYGRWAYVNTRWVWVPGPRNTIPVYAPALVVFVGGGASASVSWFPLGPRDPWTPPWRAPAANLTMFRYANRLAPGAVRTMSQIDFIAASRVHPGITVVPEGQILGSSPLLAPVRASVLGGAVRTHPAVTSRPLIARTAPPPSPISFVVTQGLLAQSQGRPLAPQQVAELRIQLPGAILQRPVVRYSVPLVSAPRTPKQVAPNRNGR